MLHAHKYPQEVVDAARQEAEQSGEELADYVIDAPVLRLGVALYFNAWFELDGERDRARLKSIPRSATFDYARDYELSEVQTDDLWFYISRMDHEFLSWYSTQLGNASDGNVDRPSN